MRALVIIGSAILLAILVQLIVWQVKLYIDAKKNRPQSTSQREVEPRFHEGSHPKRIGKPDSAAPVSLLIEALRNEVEEVRGNAVMLLVQMGQLAVPALTQALSDEDVKVRQHAIWALSEIGEDSKAAVPALIKALRDEEVEVRASAAAAFGQIGKPSKGAVTALIAVLKDAEEDLWVRQNTAYALGAIGEPDAVPELIEILKCKAEDDRARQYYALMFRVSSLGAVQFNPMTGQWTESIEEEKVGLREYAALALGMIGESAVPALIAAINDADEWVRQNAVAALGRIGDPAAVPALIEALNDEDERIRERAIVSLGLIGKPAVPALVEALRETNVAVREQVIDALNRIGTAEAMKALQEYAKQNSSGRRR
ncbi:MAG: HEAT repeat domain-containing protein [Candidatus Poribacteria bacterium]|nr:HEAT repeat domain-containing protein [Candidatus Poribacteria bacterium]